MEILGYLYVLLVRLWVLGATYKIGRIKGQDGWLDMDFMDLVTLLILVLIWPIDVLMKKRREKES